MSVTVTEGFRPLKDSDYCICCDLWKPSCGKAIEDEMRRNGEVVQAA